MGKTCNFVHNDEIWKDHVNYELQSLRKWPDKWGFLTHEYNRMHKRLVGKVSSTELPSLKPSLSTTSDSKRKHFEERKQKSEEVKLPSLVESTSGDTIEHRKAELPIHSYKKTDAKEPVQFPRTTAEEIGWKSAKPEYLLERYGRYLSSNARGQQGIRKMLKWPYQGLY